jgi:predicted transcriptional regulator
MSNPASPESLLLSPSEWQILRAVRLAGARISSEAIAGRLPSPGLSPATVAALLDRLAAKGVLQRREDGWMLRTDYAALLERQVEHFLETYVFDDPEGAEILLRLLEERRGDSPAHA